MSKNIYIIDYYYYYCYSLNTNLCADAFDYGSNLCQERVEDGTTIEQPIRFFGGTFYGPQTRQSTIQKEAFTTYWALLRLDNLIGDITFTIWIIQLMNNDGFRKVLEQKLDLQHYDVVIEHIQGKANIPADVFSRLIIKDKEVSVFRRFYLLYDSFQRSCLQRFV